MWVIFPRERVPGAEVWLGRHAQASISDWRHATARAPSRTGLGKLRAATIR